ncbi:PREDICTED: protein TPX2-like [Ipomoea nil]|uniref:protein TPX2-like n=1 Tax=Ipomoea nil TaxID=35883 RepID=UPI000901E155|nr:PREDICTED: protein TPX2-like [Ipomoea nil]
MAEMMKKFESSTREMTRPKEPELETAQRYRPVKLKSSAELEEEMMAKFPKFKVRPLNKKIYVRERAAPFISMAEMMRKFESSTSQMSMPHMNCSMLHDGMAGSVQRKPKLTLTRPKDPELEAAQRYCPVKLMSSAQLIIYYS